jgi:ketosteroid isomerase-like protein
MPLPPLRRAVTGRFGKAAPAALAVAILAAAGCSSRAGNEAAIRALLDKEVKAINARDLKALGEVWAQDDAILLFDVEPPGRFQGWEGIGRQWRDFFAAVSELSLKVETVRVQAAGDLGFATYDWTLTGRMGDYALDDRGQATAVYRRGDAGWRLVHAHYSAVPGAPDGEAAAARPPAGAAGPTAPAGGAHPPR